MMLQQKTDEKNNLPPVLNTVNYLFWSENRSFCGFNPESLSYSGSKLRGYRQQIYTGNRGIRKTRR